MVVDRDSRTVAVVAKHAVNDRIALFCLVNLDFAAVALNRRDREIDAFSDVLRMTWIDGNCRGFNETLQECFKLLPVRIGKRQQTIPFQCRGHSKSSVELSCESLESNNKQIGPRSPTGPIRRRRKVDSQHQKTSSDTLSYIQKVRCFLLFWRPVFPTETRPDG